MRFDVMPVATRKQIIEVEQAAHHVWHNYYKDIFPTEQIDYMLEKYQSADALQDQIREGYVYYMLMADGDLAGYMCIRAKNDHIILSRLYIKAEYRRQGLAKKAIAHVESMLRSPALERHDIKKIRLHVERDNHFAINVYEHLGFRKVKSVDTDIGNGYVCREYVMDRKVSQQDK